ncbi:Wiskott-Aldrich syndrome protein family member 3 [Frankliniella fusca]|uniref:Wiskott-Aldrich syndrome protein family member 3 n=1 Tax=Frankliniella fusca TaxID=407009 RepID=A0AAE1LD46_9NEOP|nr:Wiskott-Aldrich syndrome protein family member 3 [Frankliniella fusca]
MPFALRKVQPEFVSRARLHDRDGRPLVLDGELEAVFNHTLCQAIRQLSSLLQAADDMFASLAQEMAGVTARAGGLQERIRKVQELVDAEDPRTVPVLAAPVAVAPRHGGGGGHHGRPRLGSRPALLGLARLGTAQDLLGSAQDRRVPCCAGDVVPGGEQSRGHHLQHASSTPPSTPPAHLQHASSTPPALLQHASSTPPAHLQHTSSTPPARLQHASSTPPAHLQYTSSTPPAHLQHTSSTPPVRLQHASSTPPARLQHASSTPPAHLQHTSSTPPARLQHTSSSATGRQPARHNGPSRPGPHRHRQPAAV